jgi:ribosomal protein L21E
MGLDLDAVAPVPDLQSWLSGRALMQDLIRQHLFRAQERMKRQADKGRSEREFSVGDKVFLKLQPYVQSSLMRRANNKLSFRFFGPFQIIEKLGSVAYKLELPSSSSIHPVFHVSQLKLSPGNQQVSPTLPSNLQAFQVPVRVLQRRWSAGDRAGEQGLIQWSHSSPELATWESLDTLRQQFPRAPAWGHAGSEAPGIVSSASPIPEDDEAQVTGSPPGSPPRRPKRDRRPYTRVVGPAWVSK